MGFYANIKANRRAAAGIPAAPAPGAAPRRRLNIPGPRRVLGNKTARRLVIAGSLVALSQCTGVGLHNIPVVGDELSHAASRIPVIGGDQRDIVDGRPNSTPEWARTTTTTTPGQQPVDVNSPRPGETTIPVSVVADATIAISNPRSDGTADGYATIKWAEDGPQGTFANDTFSVYVQPYDASNGSWRQEYDILKMVDDGNGGLKGVVIATAPAGKVTTVKIPEGGSAALAVLDGQVKDLPSVRMNGIEWSKIPKVAVTGGPELGASQAPTTQGLGR